MPELPEVQALVELLDDKTRGLLVARCELASFSALKTFDPPLEALVGRTASGCTRTGKYLCFDFEDLWLVIHLARGGWVRWSEIAARPRARPGRGPLALRMGYSDGSGIDVTEAGTEKRLALWVVHDPAEIEPVAALGPDPLDPSFDADALAKRLQDESGTIKNALTRQSVIAGVGNAYSDEALFEAKLSPFKPADKLNHEEVSRLHAALTSVLREAVERERSPGG